MNFITVEPIGKDADGHPVAYRVSTDTQILLGRFTAKACGGWERAWEEADRLAQDILAMI